MSEDAAASRSWTFRLEATTLPGEVVCLTGSCEELGKWSMSRMVTLDVEKELPDSISPEKSAQGWTK